jgi:hypothetical protein
MTTTSGRHRNNNVAKKTISKNRWIIAATCQTNDINELQNYLHHALKGLDMALQLHFINPFQKWKLTSFIYKQKTFHKILQMIMMKQTEMDSKKVIVGPVKGIKGNLKRLCELVDVDEFWMSKLCCCFCNETAKVKYNDKAVNSVLRCSNNECGITIDRDIKGASNLFMLLTKMVQKYRRPEPFCHPRQYSVFNKKTFREHTVISRLNPQRT